MVYAFGTPKRHSRSGIFFLRKRVPDRLRKMLGKREIKISLRTRDPDIARIRHLEELLRIEQSFAQLDGVVVRPDGSPTAYIEIKGAANTGPAMAPARPAPDSMLSIPPPAEVSLIGLFKKVGERLASWVRGLGIDARVAPNHGWRHRFTSVARFIGMPEDVRHAIQGHASTKIADKYGDTWPQVFQREIEKLPRYKARSEPSAPQTRPG